MVVVLCCCCCCGCNQRCSQCGWLDMHTHRQTRMNYMCVLSLNNFFPTQRGDWSLISLSYSTVLFSMAWFIRNNVWRDYTFILIYIYAMLILNWLIVLAAAASKLFFSNGRFSSECLWMRMIKRVIHHVPNGCYCCCF